MTTGLASDVHLVCPRCAHDHDPADLMAYRGCPRCADDGVVVNLQARLPPGRVAEALRAARDADRDGMWRWAGALPVPATGGVRLGEGDTPLLELPGLAELAGVRRMSVKNETVNPTWSHKDRLAAMTVAAAQAVGCDTVTAASTGNHGAALAAYAARAGLRCVVYTLISVPPTMKTLMQAYGAEVVAVPRSEDRYHLMTEGVSRRGWFPGSNATVPPVGSHPLGVCGYRTIAYEIAEQCAGDMPDVIVVPVAYGDCVAGVAQGFADLHTAGLLDRLPVLVAAEVFGALRGRLGGRGNGPAQARDTAAFSIAAPYATEQSVSAVTGGDGTAVNVSEDELLQAQADLARTTGLFVEASSAAAFAAARRIRESTTVPSEGHVMVIATSTGLKDPSAIGPLLPELEIMETI